MKRVFVLVFVLMFLSSLVFASPRPVPGISPAKGKVIPETPFLKQDEQNTPTMGELSQPMVMKRLNLPALLTRKDYRLGIRFGLMAPCDSVSVTKDWPFAIGFDFDGKLNKNLDIGPRITYVNKKFNNGTSVNANYGFLMLGFGGRLYLAYFGDYGSAHGFLNAYLAGDINYAIANKGFDLLPSSSSPSSFSGFVANAGIGMEAAFSPNNTGFVDVRYQKGSTKDSNGISFPDEGFLLSLGTRLSFF
ncbi:MAG: hypothetical protein NTZ10_05680 [Candidatus Saganbacteria bacterium]|nr:hypothetical protein [Candidatus Saganbacteria bacterium]